jgi:hypothetical protein
VRKKQAVFHAAVLTFGETEQMEKDIEGGGAGVHEAAEGVTKLHKELGKLKDQLVASEVSAFNP